MLYTSRVRVASPHLYYKKKTVRSHPYHRKWQRWCRLMQTVALRVPPMMSTAPNATAWFPMETSFIWHDEITSSRLVTTTTLRLRHRSPRAHRRYTVHINVVILIHLTRSTRHRQRWNWRDRSRESTAIQLHYDNFPAVQAHFRHACDGWQLADRLQLCQVYRNYVVDLSHTLSKHRLRERAVCMIYEYATSSLTTAEQQLNANNYDKTQDISTQTGSSTTTHK